MRPWCRLSSCRSAMDLVRASLVGKVAVGGTLWLLHAGQLMACTVPGRSEMHSGFRDYRVQAVKDLHCPQQQLGAVHMASTSSFVLVLYANRVRGQICVSSTKSTIHREVEQPPTSCLQPIDLRERYGVRAL